jgi:hypothetical protein
VEGSRDPECDAARSLLNQGYTGTLHMLDGKTGKPRTIIDIERAAGLCVREGPVRFAPYCLIGTIVTREFVASFQPL